MLIETCRMTHDESKKVQVLEAKLDYRLQLKKMKVQYFTILNLQTQLTPIWFRTNLANESGLVGENIGVEMYWSFDCQHPKPGSDFSDGSCLLGKVQKIV